MLIEDSHKTLVIFDDDIVELDCLIKSYVRYLSIFYGKNVNLDDKTLKKKIEDLKKYINKMVGE